MPKLHKMPEDRPGFIHKFQIGTDYDGYVIVGIAPGGEEPKEICIVLHNTRKPVPFPDPSPALLANPDFFDYYMALTAREERVQAEICKLHEGLHGMLTEFGIAVSMGLQHGVPLKEFVEKFQFTRFEPAGVTSDPAVHVATSVPDLVFRWLGQRFVKEEKTDVAQEGGAQEGSTGSPEAAPRS